MPAPASRPASMAILHTNSYGKKLAQAAHSCTTRPLTLGWIAREFQESNAWAEVGQLRSMLAQRDAVWSDLPAPAAVWDSEGRLLLASVGWQRLGLPTDAAPQELELT